MLGFLLIVFNVIWMNSFQLTFYFVFNWIHYNLHFEIERNVKILTISKASITTMMDYNVLTILPRLVSAI